MREQISYKESIEKIYSIIIAFLATLYLPYILKIDVVSCGNSFFALFFCVLNIFVIRNLVQENKECPKEYSLFSYIFSLTLAFSLVFGKELSTAQSVDCMDLQIWIAIAVFTIYFSIYTRELFKLYDKFSVWLENKLVPYKGSEHAFSPKYLLITWVCIIIMWIPAFLAFYPGAFVYDASDEYNQVITRKFTTHHPLLHVLFLGGSVAFGNKYLNSYNLGIAIFVLVQMGILAGCFTYLVCFLKKYGIPKSIRYCSVLFFGLCPVIQMYAVCTTKDVMFNGFLTIIFILLLEYCINPKQFTKPIYILSFVCASVGMMLLRNNGVYAYIASLIIVLIIVGVCFLRKRTKKEFLSQLRMPLLFFISLICYVIINQSLIMVLHADNSAKQEALTVPIQQIARAYRYEKDQFTPQELEILYEVLPENALLKYNPNLSDQVKILFDNEKYAQNPKKYQKLWLDKGIQNPMIYMNAWLLTSYGLWYPDAIIDVYKGNTVYTFTYEDSSYFGFETEFPGVRESKIKWLEEFYRKISLEIYQQKVPVVSMLFSPGFLFFVFLFGNCTVLIKREYIKLFPMLPIWLIFGTFLLGPTCLVRYSLIFWILLPVILLLPCIKNRSLE